MKALSAVACLAVSLSSIALAQSNHFGTVLKDNGVHLNYYRHFQAQKMIRLLLALFSFFSSGAALSQQSILQRFINGEHVTYSTSGNSKAKGIEMSFDYPSSWGGKDGRRTNTLYQVTSEQGRGLELCNLVIKELNLPPGIKITSQEIEDLFDPKWLRDFVPASSRFIDGKRTTLDGQPGAWVQFSGQDDRAGISLQMIWLMYQVYYDRRLIIFSCGVGDSGDKPRELVHRRFVAYLPLFQLIANSIIIQSKWKK